MRNEHHNHSGEDPFIEQELRQSERWHSLDPKFSEGSIGSLTDPGDLFTRIRPWDSIMSQPINQILVHGWSRQVKYQRHFIKRNTVSLNELLHATPDAIAELMAKGTPDKQIRAAQMDIIRIVREYMSGLQISPHTRFIESFFRATPISRPSRETEERQRKGIDELLRKSTADETITPKQRYILRASYGLDDGIEHSAKKVGHDTHLSTDRTLNIQSNAWETFRRKKFIDLLRLDSVNPNLVAASAGLTLYGDVASIPDDPAYLYQAFRGTDITDPTTLFDIAMTSVSSETARTIQGYKLAAALREIGYPLP